MRDLIGRTLGSYRIVEKIGVVGFCPRRVGTVFSLAGSRQGFHKFGGYVMLVQCVCSSRSNHRINKVWVIALLALAVSPSVALAQLTEIGIGDFFGGEACETFDGTLGESFGSAAVFGGVAITSNNATISRQDYGNFDPHGGSGDPALFDTAMASDLTFEWSSPMKRVGFLLAGGNTSTSWTMSVFGDTGASLGSWIFNFDAIAGFPNDPPVFIGLQASEGIGRIEIDENGGNGQYTGIDDIRFEALVFEDGFESGNTAAWSSTVP